jgi:hypothetical protein
MILKNVTLGMALIAAMATTSSAGVYGTDVTGLSNLVSSRSGSDLVTDSNSSDKTYANLSIGWKIDYNDTTPGAWHYEYTIDVNGTKPAFSHVLLELSAGTVDGDGNLTDPNVVYHVSPDGSTQYNTAWGPQGQSDPGFPSGVTINGLKFEPTNKLTELKLSFNSDRAPVWGNFYANGGQAYAFNRGLADLASGDIHLFIARPDGQVAVPEPSGIALLGCGAFGLVGYGLRRRKAQIA